MKDERVTFWIGCHALRHGDIITTCIAILERLGVQVTAVGGPRYCCGTIKDMNAKAATVMGQGTTKRLNALGPDTVISYCPSCQTHLDDFVSEFSQTEFEFGHFVTFLHNHREGLAAMLTNPVKRRVALHLHSGFQSRSPVNEFVRNLLLLVPGLEVVDHPKITPGIHCTSAMMGLPGMLNRVNETLRAIRREYQVDDVITVFHSCHRWLCVQDGIDGLRVTNFVKILAMSMGLTCPEDVYKKWRQAGTQEQIREAVGTESIEKIGEATFDRLILPELTRTP